MEIDIVCNNEIYCDLLKAHVEHALADLQMKAEVEYVMDRSAQHHLETDAKSGMVIDGQLIAISTGYTINDMRRQIGLRSPTGH